MTRSYFAYSAMAAIATLSSNALAQANAPQPGPEQIGQFEVISPNSGICAVHMALLPENKLLLSERFREIPSDWRRVNPDGTINAAWNGDLAMATWAEQAPFYKPNPNLQNDFTDAAEFDVNSKTFKMLPYAYDLQQGYSFCNGAAQLADGSILIAGGDQKWNMPFKGRNYTTDGRRDVRVYKNGNMVKVAEMPLDTRPEKVGGDLSGRWYPTVITLPDERAMILGGQKIYFKPTEPLADNPTYEIYPGNGPKNLTTPVRVEALARAFPVNMYPVSYVLPQSGNVFMLAGNQSATLDYVNSKEIPMPQLPEDNVYPRAFPFAGTNWMNPLSSANGYKATVWVCGGANRTALPDGHDKPPVGNQTHNWFDNCHLCKATNRCYHIDPEEPNAQWIPEDMPLPRSQPQAINLADGTIGIFAGSGQGHQGGDAGISYMASAPVNQAVIFDPREPKGSQNRWKLAATATVPRMYHGTSVLLTDGSVIFAGSDENNFADAKSDPYEMRVEVYRPPYMFVPNRPSLDLANVVKTAKYGQQIVVPLTSDVGAKIQNVTFIRYGTSTHTLNIDQRLITLNILKYGKNKLLVQLPPDSKIAPPGNWMLFAVDNRGGVVTQAATINLRATNEGADAQWNEADTVEPEKPKPKGDSGNSATGVKSVVGLVIGAVVGAVALLW